MIPKQIYFYWGNETMSFMRYMSIKSCVHYNPDFEIILVTPSKKSKLIENKHKENIQDNNYFDGEDYTYKLKDLNITFQTLDEHYPEIAKLELEDHQNDDILGWYILGFKGGFKADMDILFTKPIPYDELNNLNDTQFPNVFYYYGNYGIGFLYSSCSNLYKHLYNISLKVKDQESPHYQLIGGNLLRHFIQTYNVPTYFLNNKYIYPFIDRDVCEVWENALNKPYELDKVNIVDDVCFGIHWYGGWPTSKEYNEKLIENNYKEYNNTISYYIGKVLE